MLRSAGLKNSWRSGLTPWFKKAMKREIKNKPASIRDKLTNIARTEGIDFDALLLRYFQERFLYRLSISEFSDNFVLKGG